jgi:hypothetical protein
VRVDINDMLSLGLHARDHPVFHMERHAPSLHLASCASASTASTACARLGLHAGNDILQRRAKADPLGGGIEIHTSA